jgi:hypothetical protein
MKKWALLSEIQHVSVENGFPDARVRVKVREGVSQRDYQAFFYFQRNGSFQLKG